MERRVIVARTAGFCFGVERAVDKVYEQIEAAAQGRIHGPIYTYGPIIHNEEVVRDLEEKGVRVLDTEEDLKKLPAGQGTVIIRSHGVSRHIYDILRERGTASIKIACLLDKPERRVVPLSADYTCFDIPDEFVVGYGLDYDQNYRNLPYIGVLKREVYEK